MLFDQINPFREEMPVHKLIGRYRAFLRDEIINVRWCPVHDSTTPTVANTHFVH